MNNEDIQSINNWIKLSIGKDQFLDSVELLSGGRSNMTYRAVTTDQKSVIIRVAPRSAGLARVEREYRILSGLQKAGLPTPSVYGLCDDQAVIGGYFFIMQELPGQPPGSIDWENSSHSGDALWCSLGHQLAKVHSVDIEEVGLNDLWRPKAFAERQIATWQKNLTPLESSVSAEIIRLGDMLKERLPESKSAPSLLHGDYKAENVLINPVGHDISAILDWELASFGDPMADLAWLMIWSPDQADERPWIEPPVSQVHELGDPHAAVEAYAEIKDVDQDSLEFHKIFSYWKLSSINLTTEQRFINGEMTGKDINISRLRQQVDWQIDVVRKWAI